MKSSRSMTAQRQRISFLWGWAPTLLVQFQVARPGHMHIYVCNVLKPTSGQGTERKSVCGKLTGRRDRKTVWKEEVDDWRKAVFCRHSRIAVLMNSEQLWLPTQNWYKIKPINTLEGAPTPGWGATDSRWFLSERESVWNTQVDDSTLRSIRAVRIAWLY